MFAFWLRLAWRATCSTPDGRPIKARVVACEGQTAEARAESADDGTFALPWVDGQDASGLSAADLLQLLRGTPGTSVGIGVHRPSTGQEVDVVLERGTIVR